MTVSNVISPLMVTADRFIISGVIGASMVAYYTVPMEVVSRILIIPGALATVLFPRLAAGLISDQVERERIYNKAIKTLFLILLPICSLVALGSKIGLTLWLGADFASHSWLIVCILSLGVFFNGIAFIPFSSIQAKGNSRFTAIIHSCELLFYIPILLFCLRHFGVVGAAASWTLRVIADFLILFISNH